jgi:hypothetical protein
VIAAQKGLAHPVQNLRGVTLKPALAKQYRESVFGRVNPNLDCAAIAAVQHLVDDGGLLGLSPMQGPAER